MPELISSSPVHCTRPLWMQPTRGYTAEMADGVETGSRAAYNAQHFLHYRYGGPCHWSFIRRAESSGTIYFIIDHPERRDSGDQNLFIMLSLKASADTGYKIEWRDNFGAGAYTTLWEPASSSAGAVSTHWRVIPFTPPTSATNSQKVIEFKYTDCYPQALTGYMVGEQYIPATQQLMPDGANGVGQVISKLDTSVGGLIKAIGDCADDVESIERLTRRTFFSQSHPDGSYLDGAVYTDVWTNMFAEHRFKAYHRGLTSESTVYCHPAAVIMSHNHTGRDQEVKIRFENVDVSATWTYTLQAGDAEDTPLFINQWRTGSSTANGLKLTGGDVEICGYATDSASLTLLSWALFEGPAF